MRQKAVSIAPQNEAPIQIAPTAATIPIVVELARMRSSARPSSSCSAAGNRLCRSLITLSWMSEFSNTCPKTNRTSRANGKTARARLKATIPARPVMFSR